MPEKKQWHFFASSIANWTVDDDLLKCLERQRRADRGIMSCNVWKVPLPKDAHYRIEYYQPMDVGAEFIDTILY